MAISRRPGPTPAAQGWVPDLEPQSPRAHDQVSAENPPALQWDLTRQNAPEAGTREMGKAGEGEAGREQAKTGRKGFNFAEGILPECYSDGACIVSHDFPTLL